MDLSAQISDLTARRDALLDEAGRIDQAIDHLEQAQSVLTEPIGSGDGAAPTADELRAVLEERPDGTATISEIVDRLGLEDGRSITGARIAAKREGWLEVNDGSYRLVDA